MSLIDKIFKPKQKYKIYKKTKDYILKVNEVNLNEELLYQIIIEEISSGKVYTFPYLFDEIHSKNFNPEIKNERLFGVIYQDNDSKKIPPEFLINGGLIGVIFERESKTFNVINIYGQVLYVQPE